jgi:hypothetical protein
MEQEDLADFMKGLPDFFTAMGYTMKVEEPVYELEQIEFCQTQPVLVGDEYRMVRQHDVALVKDRLSLKPLDSRKTFDRMRYSVGMCGLSLCSGVPVFQEFYSMLLRGADVKRADRDKEMTGMRHLAIGMEARRAPVTDATRASYAIALGIPIDEQLALEEEYRGIVLKYRSPFSNE